MGNFTVWLLKTSLQWSCGFLLVELLLIVVFLLQPSRRWANTVRKVGAPFMLCCPFVYLSYGVGYAIYQHTSNPPSLEPLVEPVCHILMAFALLAIVAIIGRGLIDWKHRRETTPSQA